MATFKDALVVGIVFGVIIGLAAYAVRAWLRLRSASSLTDAERRKLRGGALVSATLALAGMGLVVFAISRPPDLAKLQQGLYQGCQQRCLADGGQDLVCDRYCTCYVRELSAAHGARGLNELIALASRENDAAALETLSEQGQKCAARL